MKKYISFFATAFFAAMITSCTNDDVAISKTVNFTVNPSTVVGTFSVGEENAGDLESFHTDCKLNVRLFIYNEDGDLVEKANNTYSNYAVQMKASFFLPQGNYTAVAITHIDDVVDNIKYWVISGESHLEGMRITDGGYIGGQNKVLGVAVSTFSVKDEIVDLNMNVLPAGSMLTVRYYNYLALKSLGYTQFTLYANKTMDYLEFDRSGKTEVVADNHNGSYDWIVDNINASNFASGYDYIYSYEFILPMTNVGLQFFTEDESSYYSLGASTSFTTLAGSCYYAYLNLSSKVSNISSSFGKYSHSRSAEKNEKGLLFSPKKKVRSLTKGQTLYVKDLK